MKKSIIFSLVVFFAMIFNAQSQTVLGKWKTIDDETGQAKSIVEVYEKSGKVYGKIVDILNPEKRKNLCSKCSGEDKNAPILGLIIIKGLVKDGDEYNGGKILDPVKGEEYKCLIALDGKDKLKVRGFVGVSLFGRTQYWFRVK
ncbi:DUF2147 domain-containing protein [Flavobacterium taihuense]|uniref:DUF2147 domain-containing protein n=1 Tax=Flavobacterium taihuense TaxID=2857508 RepID=A0ABS6XXQ1_9FLAO|nr:DUF2147 domain-containing protein [Flavobacterium taihuense]MBW4361446.1 DUF2147 domain-containing protein [Flavobacterium taihuense]